MSFRLSGVAVCPACGRILHVPVPGVLDLDDEAAKVLGHECADTETPTEGTI